MKQLLRLALAFAIAASAAVLVDGPAGAVPPAREPSQPSGFGEVPAGVACTFAVSIDLISGDQGQVFTFFDHSGNVVRQMGTARPSTWKITNLDTGASRTVDLPAGHLTLTTSADGTITIEISGGAIGFNSPSDTPAGPFAFTNVGRLVQVIAPDGTGTLLKVTGQRFDLCAAVAS